MKGDFMPIALGRFLSLLCIIHLFLFCWAAPAQGDATPMPASTFASEPPFKEGGIPPNLLLMLDNSASMYDPAYVDTRNKMCSKSDTACSGDSQCPTGETCSQTYCLDDSYQDGNSYTGYFSQQSIYSYDPATKRFVAGAALPPAGCSSSSCAASTGYLYVEMSGSKPNRTVSVFKASGKFLNWLSMSKLDVEKMVLSGGKFSYDPNDSSHQQGVLQGETRGCQGKRFVKMIGDSAQITFAVRGPIIGDPGFSFRSSHGGATTIEIYDNPYHKAACLKAISVWINQGTAQQLADQTNACMGVAQGGADLFPGAVYNQAMSDCYVYLVQGAAMPPVDPVLVGYCQGWWQALFGDLSTLYFSDIVKVDGFCGGNLRHAPSTMGGNTIGYLGHCYSSGGSGSLDTPPTDSCLQNQLLDYCNDIKNPVITDPSSAANATGTNANIPGFVLDAGIGNLGRAAGSFNAALYVDKPPVGLIQQFSGSINFGAMVFNGNGASAAEAASGGFQSFKHCNGNPYIECSTVIDCRLAGAGSCVESVDGGRIISYLNDPASPVGDHGSGLVAKIDQVVGNSWTPFAEAFYNAIGYFANRTDLRLNNTDFDPSKPPLPQYSCQQNNILILGDGMSTADGNSKMEALATLYRPGNATGHDSANSCPVFLGSRSLDDLAWIAAHRNIKTLSTTAPASTDPPASADQSIITHVLFTGVPNGAPGQCDPATLMKDTATAGGGLYATNTDPNALKDTLWAQLHQIATGAGAGSDACIRSSGSGNGSIFLQQQYYPSKSFDGGNSSSSWVGEMQNLWYYIDPFLANSGGTASTIREDTDGDRQLSLKNDRVVQFQDNAATLFYDANADGIADGVVQQVPPDAVRSLWRAGTALWQRAAADRTIYTQTDGRSLTSFATLASDARGVQLLQAADSDTAQQIVSYISGVDSPGFRNRTLTIPAGSVPGVNQGSYVWKLGDLISSAPKVQSPSPLGSYHLSSPAGFNDYSYQAFIGSDAYRKRGTVYVGANDGMLHAFDLGRVDGTVSGDIQATLSPKTGESITDLGKEQWAFIPRNVLPYLTYLKDPNYRHLYLVDGGISLFDASIGDGDGACSGQGYWSCQKSGNSWRTVLIGGMGLGGASWSDCSAAPNPANPDPANPGNGPDCVPTPIADPADPGKRVGYSSYFALDVTDPDHPSLLWEFSHPDLGFATTGPAIVRVGDPGKNGRWFAVFGSGPTGPIVNNQFLGQSDKPLQFFVVDLRSGALVATVPSHIQYAFAGSLSGGAIDVDRRPPSSGSYQDDAIYHGYTVFDAAAKSWTKGGVGRIMIDDLRKSTGDFQEPTDAVVAGIWHWSRLIGYDPNASPNDPTGPVTSAIARLQDTRNNKLWLYFGTGRYYYRYYKGATFDDDWGGNRSLYGIQEPCYQKDGVPSKLVKSCTLPVCTGAPSADCITDQTTTISSVNNGWRINLDPASVVDPASGGTGAERVIAGPLPLAGGGVYFTTFQPSFPCRAGNSYLWGVRYDTGDAIPAGSIQGKVLMQLSSGRVQETGMGGLSDKGGRRGPAVTGSKPGGIKVVTNSGLKPVKKILHIQER